MPEARVESWEDSENPNSDGVTIYFLELQGVWRYYVLLKDYAEMKKELT